MVVVVVVVVQGPAFSLDVGGRFACSRSEAAMWALVNPFSPLADGRCFQSSPF
jgi:hypothetical protein